jgi:hypothetical protein
LFRRTKTADTPSATGTVTSAPVSTQGKGRPTPSRREAEAAARARARAVTDKKSASRAARASRSQRNATFREGMRNGDERYLPARDQGKVRRFIRDYVDSRLCMAELLLPLLVVIMVMQAVGYARLSTALWEVTILLVVVDTLLMVFRLRRELTRRFPDESRKGTTFYAVIRAMQIRFLRQPKPQVKLGHKPA